MPVTPKQLEHMRQLQREYRAKQDAFLSKWREGQREKELAMLDALKLTESKSSSDIDWKLK